MRPGPVRTLFAVALAAASVRAGDAARYRKDVQFLLDELEKRAGHFFERKRIDWKSVRARFNKEVSGVADDAAHVRLRSSRGSSPRAGRSAATGVPARTASAGRW